jgi:phosphoglycerate dehydrogenase-like enzyme
MKVVLAHDFGPDFVDDMRRAYPQIDLCPAYSEEESVREIGDAEVLIGEITPQIFPAARQLKWFHYVGIGFDKFVHDIPGFVDSDFIFTNCRETHVISMADHVFAMILAFAHRLPELLEDQQNHTWNGPRYRGRVLELAGTTMGILALGDIGRAVAQRARGFDMEVYAIDIHPMDPPPEVRAVWPPERLGDMLALVDWLVVTAPLTSQTQNMIDRQALEHLKPGAFIVVVSRGHIVNEEALIEGLKSGRIAGAGLDALDQEPLPPDHSLWDTPNVIISPHSSADSAQMWQRREQITRQNLHRYLTGEPLMYLCDKKAGY